MPLALYCGLIIGVDAGLNEIRHDFYYIPIGMHIDIFAVFVAYIIYALKSRFQVFAPFPAPMAIPASPGHHRQPLSGRCFPAAYFHLAHIVVTYLVYENLQFPGFFRKVNHGSSKPLSKRP